MTNRIDMDFATFARSVTEGVGKRDLNLHITAGYLLECYGNHLTITETVSKIFTDSTCQDLINK